jgi:hypothetical protein
MNEIKFALQQAFHVAVFLRRSRIVIRLRRFFIDRFNTFPGYRATSADGQQSTVYPDQ